MARRAGFTLIELLIVTVLIGVIASIAVLHFRQVTDRAYYAAMESDLRGLSLDQELFFAAHETYTDNLDEIEFSSSAPGTSVTVTYATISGWAAYATHRALPGRRCSLYYGDAPAEAPAVEVGAITCDY